MRMHFGSIFFFPHLFFFIFFISSNALNLTCKHNAPIVCVVLVCMFVCMSFILLLLRLVLSPKLTCESFTDINYLYSNAVITISLGYGVHHMFRVCCVCVCASSPSDGMREVCLYRSIRHLLPSTPGMMIR
jgi:hypothetical protein